MAKVAFDTARGRTVRWFVSVGGRGGDCRLSSQACRKAAAGKSGCHGTTGDVDKAGACSSRETWANRPKPPSVCSFSLKSPRCKADLGLSICIPAAMFSASSSLDRGRAGVESTTGGNGAASLLLHPLELGGLSSSGDPGLEPWSRLLILRMISWRLIGSCLKGVFGERGRPV